MASVKRTPVDHRPDDHWTIDISPSPETISTLPPVAGVHGLAPREIYRDARGRIVERPGGLTELLLADGRSMGIVLRPPSSADFTDGAGLADALAAWRRRARELIELYSGVM
jgi:hypothetical protein